MLAQARFLLASCVPVKLPGDEIRERSIVSASHQHTSWSK